MADDPVIDTYTRREPSVVFRLPNGFHDTPPGEMEVRRRVVTRMEDVCKLYGFVPLDTSALQRADAIGRFDALTTDAPDEDTFALKDIDEQWLALRVELTPCLMRAVAQNRFKLPLRCFQFGTVWRRTTGKLDRRRALDHFDIDLIGVGSPIGDAELCSVVCSIMESLGFAKGDYYVRTFNRKALAALLELVGESHPMECWHSDGTVGPILAAMDAMHSRDLKEVHRMLVGGLPDAWGDRYWSRLLTDAQANLIISFLQAACDERAQVVSRLRPLIADSAMGQQSIGELDAMDRSLDAFGLGSDRVIYDPSFVRGSSFYSGTTLEVVVNPEPAAGGVKLMRGKERLRRAVAFGGRYPTPATTPDGSMSAVGLSIDMDRLMLRISRDHHDVVSPVIVTMLDQHYVDEYIKMVRDLRMAGVAAELATVDDRLARQIQYADRRGSRLAIICGEDEFATGHVLIRDLWQGKEQSLSIGDRKEWLRQSRDMQIPVRREEMVGSVQRLLSESVGGKSILNDNSRLPGFAANTPSS